MKLGFADGAEYTSKAFRRGATQELLQGGNSLDVIKGSGGWAGSGFRSYVDLEMDTSFRIARLLVVLSDDESSEDERVKKRNRDDKKRRQKWRRQTAKGSLSPNLTDRPQFHKAPKVFGV